MGFHNRHNCNLYVNIEPSQGAPVITEDLLNDIPADLVSHHTIDGNTTYTMVTK